MGHIFSKLNISNCSDTEDFQIEPPPISNNKSSLSSLNPSFTLTDNNSDESSEMSIDPYDSGDDCTIIHEDKQSTLPFPAKFIAEKQLPLDEIFSEVTEKLNFQYNVAHKREKTLHANYQTNASSTDGTTTNTPAQDKIRLRKKL